MMMMILMMMMMILMMMMMMMVICYYYYYHCYYYIFHCCCYYYYYYYCYSPASQRAGQRAGRREGEPASQPASLPASQPASQPAGASLSVDFSQPLLAAAPLPHAKLPSLVSARPQGERPGGWCLEDPVPRQRVAGFLAHALGGWNFWPEQLHPFQLLFEQEQPNPCWARLLSGTERADGRLMLYVRISTRMCDLCSVALVLSPVGYGNGSSSGRDSGWASYYTILYYTIPYCPILYYTVLYYTILCYAIPYYTIPYHTIPYHTIPYYTILYYTILYYTIL